MGTCQLNYCMSPSQFAKSDLTSLPLQQVINKDYAKLQKCSGGQDYKITKKTPDMKNMAQSTHTRQELSFRSRMIGQVLKPQEYDLFEEQIMKSNIKEVKLDDFVILSKIGEGSFANVFKGYLKKDQTKKDKKIYAIKQMKKNQIHNLKVFSNIKLQKRIIRESQSNFITKFSCAFNDQLNYYIVMEYAAAGDVCSLISGDPKIRRDMRFAGEKVLRFILGCTILGLEDLHKKGIVHQDLKPDNMLIFQDGYVKLSDFGFSRDLKARGKYEAKVGTPEYFAPEIILHQQIGREVDLWTLGVVAYILLTFEFPFAQEDIDDGKKYTEAIMKGLKGRSWRSRSVSQELKDFINGLLKREPSERLGAKGWQQVKEHPFFSSSNFDWEALTEKKMESPLLSMITVDTSEEPNAEDIKILLESLPKEQDKGPFQRWTWISQGDYNIQ